MARLYRGGIPEKGYRPCPSHQSGTTQPPLARRRLCGVAAGVYALAPLRVHPHTRSACYGGDVGVKACVVRGSGAMYAGASGARAYRW
jgi:hypothetical protein